MRLLLFSSQYDFVDVIVIDSVDLHGFVHFFAIWANLLVLQASFNQIQWENT